MKPIQAIIAISALVLITNTAAAEAPLTSKVVKSFIDCMPEVQKLSEQFAEETSPVQAMAPHQRTKTPTGMPGMGQMPSSDDIERAATPFTSSLSEIRESKELDKMVALVKKHGFSGIEQWASVGDRAMRAYAALQMQSDLPKANKQIKEMRKQLAASGMPAAQQEAMLDMMTSSQKVMQQFSEVPDADKKAVEPHVKAFRKIGHPYP